MTGDIEAVMAPRPGGPATVAVPVATLWTTPDELRPTDGDAVWPVPDVPGWVAGMAVDVRTSSASPTLTQALRGETAIVDELAADEAGQPWARVVLPAQPSPSQDPRGYPGWMPLAHLTGHPTDPAPTHVVAAPVVELREAPQDAVLARLVVGTRVRVIAEADGWARIAPIGGGRPGYARTDTLSPLLPGVPEPADFLAVAATLVGTPYVWGGMSAYGIDCSGLIHLSCRRHHVTIPRDAAPQADVTTPLVFGTERPGDVYFFARPGKRVHHVGFVAAPPDPDGTRHMLHACGTSGQVLRETITGDRLRTLVAVHRLPTT